MPGPLDQPTPVRADASFDVAALAAWLREREKGLEGEPELLQFGRGFSNLTYLVRFGSRELVVRRAPPGVNIKSAHDMGREFRILSALAPVWSKAPRPVAYC
jgi:aminoglycoside phosphotransferase (APT) family kinase protein